MGTDKMDKTHFEELSRLDSDYGKAETDAERACIQQQIKDENTRWNEFRKRR